jgi:HlyD family secretion protein
MKNSINIGLIILILVGSLSSCNHKKITPYRGKVKYETISVAPKLAGRIKEIYFKKGELVKEGDTLASIDIPELEGKKMQAQGAVKAAKAQLQMAYNGATIEQIQQIDGKLEAAQAQFDFVKESLNRIKNMYKDSLVPKQKYDEILMKYNMAKAQLEAISAKKKEITKGTRKEVIAQAKGQLERAYGALKEIETAEKEQYLLAPSDFLVQDISLSKGELATPGYSIFAGYNPHKIFFRFSIPESKIHTFKKDSTYIIINPYTKQEIQAGIQYIKQLPRYADITSPASSYHLTEPVYEIVFIPQKTTGNLHWINQSTVLIK